MANIHFILQGKGGVGKSLIASLLAQYYVEKERASICIDTDPVNKSFSDYKALNVKTLNILNNAEIDSSKFDELIELIYGNSDTDFIIDNGASCFVPLSKYLIENKSIEMLSDAGHTVIVHSVVTGGQSMMDTLHGLKSLASSYPTNAEFIIWKNNYWGEVISSGKSFEELPVYNEIKSKINATIEIPKMQRDTFERDFINMLAKKHTFNEGINDATLGLMPRQRLKMLQRKLFEQINLVF